MIIKPAVGGNLLIQDRAGGAVLSTGTSGATMASNVTGIPAAGVTGVLPAAVTVGTSVVLPTGSIIQVTEARAYFRTHVNNTQTKLQEGSITLKQANSDIWIDVKTGIEQTIGYEDIDVALAVGWKAASSSGTSTDYTQIHTTSFSREDVSGLEAYYAQDTFSSSGTGAIYVVDFRGWAGIADLGNNAAGTVIYVSHWASTNGSVYFGGGGSVTTNDSGVESTITIMEIAR
jgi:hypothetical protein